VLITGVTMLLKTTSEQRGPEATHFYFGLFLRCNVPINVYRSVDHGELGS